MSDSLARVRDRELADIIAMLDLAVDILETIPPSETFGVDEWDEIRTALATAANFLADLREDLR
jgi:hypothetical protein